MSTLNKCDVMSHPSRACKNGKCKHMLWPSTDFKQCIFQILFEVLFFDSYNIKTALLLGSIKNNKYMCIISNNNYFLMNASINSNFDKIASITTGMDTLTPKQQQLNKSLFIWQEDLFFSVVGAMINSTYSHRIFMSFIEGSSQ